MKSIESSGAARLDLLSTWQRSVTDSLLINKPKPEIQISREKLRVKLYVSYTIHMRKINEGNVEDIISTEYWDIYGKCMGKIGDLLSAYTEKLWLIQDFGH